jgi:hypothetical protein
VKVRNCPFRLNQASGLQGTMNLTSRVFVYPCHLLPESDQDIEQEKDHFHYRIYLECKFVSGDFRPVKIHII